MPSELPRKRNMSHFAMCLAKVLCCISYILLQLVGVFDGIWRIRNTRVVDQVARGSLRSVEREGFEGGGDLNDIKNNEHKRYVRNTAINQNDTTNLFTRHRLW